MLLLVFKGSAHLFQPFLISLCKVADKTELDLWILQQINSIQMLRTHTQKKLPVGMQRQWSSLPLRNLSYTQQPNCTDAVWPPTNSQYPVQICFGGITWKGKIGTPVTQQCGNVIWELGPADCDTAAEWKQVKDKTLPSGLHVSRERAGLVTSVISW